MKKCSLNEHYFLLNPIHILPTAKKHLYKKTEIQNLPEVTPEYPGSHREETVTSVNH